MSYALIILSADGKEGDKQANLVVSSKMIVIEKKIALSAEF